MPMARDNWTRLAIVLTAVLAITTLPAPEAFGGGDERWVRRHESALRSWGPARGAIATSRDGSTVFVTGGDDGDYLTVAYAASTGDELWVQRFDRGEYDTAADLAVSPDGSRVFVTGVTQRRTAGGDYVPDFTTVSYMASTGRVAWTRTYGRLDTSESVGAVSVSPDGTKVFVTGHTGDTHADGHTTVAYAASTGRALWVRPVESRFGGGLAYRDPLAVSPRGSLVFVAGAFRGSAPREDQDVFVHAYAPRTGRIVWQARYDAGARRDDRAYSIAVDPTGSRLFVTGQTADREGQAHNIAVAYAASTGRRLWATRSALPGSTPMAIAASPDGSKLFATGASYGHGTGFDYATIAYAASTGRPLWARRYDGEQDFDHPASMAVSRDGSKVFITGISNSNVTGNDYATLAYAASDGTTLWLNRYDGVGVPSGSALGFDEAMGVASGARDSVFVTGWSCVVRCGFATIAYSG